MRFGFLFYLCVSYVHLIFAQSIENESFLLVFKEQADLSEIPNTLKKEEKGQLVYKLLNSYARESQNQVVERLDEMGLRYHCFWIANVIEVNAAPDQIQLLKAMEDVVEIVPNTRIKIPEDLIEEGIAVHGRNATELPWGLSMIQADKVWDLGIRGQGVVIGGHDT
ncbi:MAG: hypothetical protein KDC53_22130, partial [Saprospiraceae bacterium]|nr:hypothetical protein [Saprospiraceae bacterium]